MHHRVLHVAAVAIGLLAAGCGDGERAELTGVSGAANSDAVAASSGPPGAPTVTRPAGCAPRLEPLDPSDVPVGDPVEATAFLARFAGSGEASLLGGPFGFEAPGPLGTWLSAGRFTERWTPSVVRFGCSVAADVAGSSIVSVHCDQAAFAEPPERSPQCSAEVHDVATLERRAAFDVPLDRRLEGVAGDAVVFSAPWHAPVGTPQLVATDLNGRELWRRTLAERPETVHLADDLVVAVGPWTPDRPSTVTTLDAATGAVLAEAPVDDAVVGLNDEGLWVLRVVSVVDYGTTRAGDDGTLRLLDPRTLEIRAISGPSLAGIRWATVDKAVVFVQVHTPDGGILLGIVDGASLEPEPVAELPLADLGRSGSGAHTVIGRSPELLWLARYGAVPLPPGTP